MSEARCRHAGAASEYGARGESGSARIIASKEAAGDLTGGIKTWDHLLLVIEYCCFCVDM
jgi:hypothetical protein